MKKFLGFLGNEFLLGTLIALLSVLTALASYQGALAGGKQNDYEIEGMKSLNDGNAEYLTSNQEITQDYSYYDTWYINQETNPDIADYFQAEFSDELLDAIERSGSENPFDEEYYNAKYQIPSEYFDESDINFETAGDWNERGDQLQLVLTIMAIGLAFAAWASLMKEESNLRVFFSLFAIITLLIGLITYLSVPVIG
ncbi:MAG: hypothetical protein HZB18_13655 [Chloroflexi bacterium]|nr:hypothetical protein [Chloroflexota bacterium]